MSNKEVITLLESEIQSLQEQLLELNAKGCENCGYYGSEALAEHELTEKINIKIHSYTEALEGMDE